MSATISTKHYLYIQLKKM